MMMPISELGDVKVGDTVQMQVASITDGMALLKPAEMKPMADESPEEMPMPSDEEAKTMPLDKLEKRLPKADRE